MADLTNELHEELEAFDPRWQDHYPSLGKAALAAGVVELYRRWTETADGKKYLATVAQLPDHAGVAKREAEAMTSPSSLPYGYSNCSLLLKGLLDDGREFRPR